MKSLKIGAGMALFLGLALTLGAVLYVGAGGLLRAAERIGWSGFTLYTLYNLGVFIPLGLAWWSVAPSVDAGRAMLFPWGRLVREAASDVLPLSQVGGLWAGVRAVRQRGIPEALAVASQIADLVTEMAAQLVYTLFGVAVLAAMLSHGAGARSLLWSGLLALGVGAACLAGFIALQGRGLDLLGALASRWIADTQARADAVKAVLKEIYGDPRRLAAGFLLHGLSWLLSGAGSFMALRFMGAHIEAWKVFALESLMAAVRSVAFMTPGGLGFQESAYVLAAPLFGVAPGGALTLSLLRRAKDLVIGVGAMLAWQALERAAAPARAAVGNS
ncbi:MAG: flippase-like domain-containing protein [Caulobacteraceae bacterium]|nr:flippase-like domain-containing protein [Caulobacteraceae bacterium]